MPQSRGAGQLHERVAFDKLASGSDGLGGTTAGWQEQFSCRAAFIHLRGGESVMAGRLSGKHTLVLSVRASSAARAVTTDWRVRNLRDGDWKDGVVGGTWTGQVFNVRDVTPSADRAWLDILCEAGVAP